MYYVLTFLIGVVLGGVCLFLFIAEQHKKLKELAQQTEAKEAASKGTLAKIRIREAELDRQAQEMNRQAAEFKGRVVSYVELQQENSILKRDLQNIDVNLQKLRLDNELLDVEQRKIDQRSMDLAKRYLSETVKAVVAAVGPSNFSACKQKLITAITKCRDIGFAISAEEEERLLAELRGEFENAVRLEFQREEQARIKAQIREEERLKREVERELKQLERERAAIQAALDQALAEARGQHSAEVERLQARLAEAEEKSRRTMSMAQQTKAGYVYVISNIGKFGEGIFKVGMTRRLDPMERVTELGSASVPFPFDVHMMIQCNDAPSLENALHRALHRSRVNKARPRKEFFKTDIEAICDVVRQHHGQIDYVAEPEALEYRQSLTMSQDDAAYVEKVYDAMDEGEKTVSEEH
jgi:hypothetical protein